MTQQERKAFMRQMFMTAFGAMLIICIPAWGSIYWMRTKDHFKLEQTVSKEQIWSIQATLTLLIEEKTRAIESLAISNAQTAKANAQNIDHMEEQIDELKALQKEIDNFLRKEYRQRGYNPPLPEY